MKTPFDSFFFLLSLVCLLSFSLCRYPQLHNCGRPSLPEQLWILDAGNDASDIDRSAIPLVEPVQLTDDHALPAFMVRVWAGVYKGKRVGCLQGQEHTEQGLPCVFHRIHLLLNFKCSHLEHDFLFLICVVLFLLFPNFMRCIMDLSAHVETNQLPHPGVA